MPAARPMRTAPAPRPVEGNIYLLDAQGQVLVELTGVRVQRVGRSAGDGQGSDSSDWLYRVAWRTEPLADGTVEAGNATVGASRPRWLVFADDFGAGKQLAQQLRQSGDHYWLVLPGAEFQMITGENGSARHSDWIRSTRATCSVC